MLKHGCQLELKVNMIEFNFELHYVQDGLRCKSNFGALKWLHNMRLFTQADSLYPKFVTMRLNGDLTRSWLHFT